MMKGRIRRLFERISGLPLRWQIGTLVMLGLVAIFTIVWLLGGAIADDAKQRTMDGWLAVTRSSASAIDSIVDAEYRRLEQAAALLSTASDDPARQRVVLADTLVDADPLVDGTALLDADGHLVWSSSSDAARIVDLATVLRLGEQLRASSRYASGAQDLASRAGVVIAVPVRDARGQTTGVLAMLLWPEQGPIEEIVANARGLADSGHAELIDQTDHVIVSSEPGRALGMGEHPDFYGPLLAQNHSTVGITAPVGASDPTDAGQRHDMAFVALRSAPWALALGGSDVELSASSNRWQSQILVLGLLVLGLALVLVWLTTRSVAQPILALAAASRKIAAGDLATPVPHDGEGEVRVLAHALEHMRGELRGALADLALEKSRYEGIVVSMADAVITTDGDLRVTAFNPSAELLTGWTAAEALGTPCADVISACAGREPGVAKGTLRLRDGRDVPVAVTRSTIRGRDGSVAGVVHVLRDISAEAEVDRLKDEFLSTVSHELRTPLGFIMGYATSLLLPDAAEDRATTRRCAEVIAEASQELKELVDNLLDMAKIGAGSLSVTPEPTSLQRLVRRAVERIRVRAPQHRFIATIPASLPSVRADSHRIEQVLYNLLDNAIKYSPDGGRIDIRAHADRSDVIVSVIDEGLGIAPQELDSMFERFHRGRVARTRGIAGTGLGLTICRGIVEAHGGRIWVESPAAQARSGHRPGTAVHFTVPLAGSLVGVAS